VSGNQDRRKEDAMRAQVGDRIVVSSPVTGGTVRDGEIVEVRGGEGCPTVPGPLGRHR